jgi:cytochrome P450
VSPTSEIPGPGGLPILGVLTEFRKDRLGFLVRTARRYGGVAQFALRGRPVFLITDPAGVKRVLQDNADNYERKTRSVEALRETLGNGLITTTGAFWRRNRRLAQPAFHKQRLGSFAAVMAEAASDAVTRLGAEGKSFDVVPELLRLTLRILGRCLFSRELTDAADTIEQALVVVLRHTIDRLGQLIPLPTAVPTPKHVRFRRALRALDRVVVSLIDERRRAGASDGAPGDLLSMLLAARDEETGEGLSDQQLRDEVMTLLLAGHETTAMTLAWALYLLSLHPDVRRRLEEEVDGALAGRRPVLDDLPRLRYTRMVLEETLRLYPVAWGITRSTAAADEIGGYAIPANAMVIVSPYVTHRDPTLWPDPEGFDPERFAVESSAPRYAYFPFGGGPHLCIGAGFAMMEATIVLATITQRLRLDLEPARPVTVEPLVTLRPRPGIWVTANRR